MSAKVLPLTPLANCVADTQGGIGYLIQQALNNRLAHRGEQKAVTVVTQVEVDKNDPGFTHPNEPIGAFFSEAQRDDLRQRHPDWHFVEDAGRGYRRVVASPEPKRIVEAEAIKALTRQGFVVIGAGGGGIPVVRSAQGDYQSVDAVIDKDLSTALLAREIHADILAITTGVEKVCIHFGQPRQQALGDGQYQRHDPLYAGRPLSGRQHVAQNCRQPRVFKARRQAGDYHHPRVLTRSATRGDRHPSCARLSK